MKIIIVYTKAPPIPINISIANEKPLDWGWSEDWVGSDRLDATGAIMIEADEF
jgi:hypothetical protein